MGASIAITNRSLHDQVAGRIRDLIIEGTLEPGSRIDEAHLIEELGVSRTPFREALRTLGAVVAGGTLRTRGAEGAGGTLGTLGTGRACGTVGTVSTRWAGGT